MFTGLIESLGVVRALRRGSRAVTLEIASDLAVEEMIDGESVSVSGVCLTVTTRRGGRFHVDVIPETMRRTTLRSLRPGADVNLERALKVGDRLGGHFVQGHVDGTARVDEVIRRSGEWRVRLEPPGELSKFIAYKGSVAIDGVSLTIASVDQGRFDVALIPETIRRTTLGKLSAGSEVNVEVDVIARYLETMLDATGVASRRRGDR